YIAKGAGAGLSKIGDISKALKGVGNIEIPKLPDGSVHLPDGRLLDTDGNLIGHDGTIDTTPAPHEVVPGLPADWTIQEPALSGVRAGDGVPDGIHGHAPSGTFDGPPTTYDHAPAPAAAPATFDHTSTATPHGHVPATFEHTPTATPHDAPVSTPHPGSGHDLPHGSGHDTPSGHGDDGAHGSGHDHHDGAAHDHHDGSGHDGAGHDGSDHTDDVAGHGDDAVHTGDHAGDGYANPHGGADEGIAGAGHHDSGVPGASGPGDTFEYEPHVSDERWADLSTAEKHQIAYAEISQGTVPFHSSTEAIKYGQAYWNHYAESMPEVQRKAVYDYTVEPNYADGPPTPEGWGTYKEMNGFLRGDTTKWSPYVQHNIDEVDRALAGNPVPEDLMVVRGTGIGHLKLDDPLEMLGRTYDDKGFMSTSLGDHPVPAFAGEDALLHLRVPKGTPALWVERVSKFGMGERELLLGRGTQFRVTRVFMDNGQVQVYGEVLPR
ncbi:ADP-ribosyltransferase, partial [Streptomyces sp. MI02-2A]|uniref:ADP-ribosyltransferase n=1 Tax=Streptomyces sp. MI02-2A TaxID=3028688 RepID=UPI0029B1526E